MSLVAFLLISCFALSSFPLNAVSLGESSVIASVSDSGSSDICVVEEDVTKRSEFEKHFLCSDGIYRAVTYAESVHYYDAETDTWNDNNVALKLNAASSRYEAQSGKFSASFARSYTVPVMSTDISRAALGSTSSGISQSVASKAEQTVTMTNGTYPISWTTVIKPNNTAVMTSSALVTRSASVIIPTAVEADMTAEQSYTGRLLSDADALSASNRLSVAEYSNIARVAGQNSGISLRYTVSQNKIKEDIILANKYVITDFVTTLNIGDLIAVKQDDGSVLLNDINGEAVYKVWAPFMYDSKDEVCHDVEVTVEQNGSLCAITYSPDRDWLNEAERAYPVVLDPSITSREYSTNIVDTYVAEGNATDHSAEANLFVGIKSGKINRAYIKINNLPTLPSEVVPMSANLTIKHGANTTTGKAMNLYKVKANWNPSTVTYANQPLTTLNVGYSPFDTVKVSFDISQTEITDLYSRAANGANYGYMICYSDESTVDPDYNALRSMEYPTASERPCFTVYYSYTLPVGITEGAVYSFKNANSDKYLDVCGGTDADDNNVAQYTGNSTASQRFKLEKSSTGNGYILRSQVGGKTRVLDIYKTNGRVENGNNVQIYRNIDPIAQEWLIIPATQYTYRIVPRSNPMLSLATYGKDNGSASGKTTTSAGNAFVTTSKAATLSQFWYVIREDGTSVMPTYDAISNGEYYLNNSDTSKYLRCTPTIQGTSGLTSSLGNSIKWKFTNVGGRYLIQPLYSTNLYLCETTSGNRVSAVTIKDTIPESCLWTVTKPDVYSDYMVIKSSSGRTLCSDGTTIKAELNPSSGGKWRYVKTSEMRELTNLSLNISQLVCFQSENISIIGASGCSFIGANDLEFQLLSSNPSSCLTLTDYGTTAKVTANAAGTAFIKVTNKVAATKNVFGISISKYELYVGFSADNYKAGCQYEELKSSIYVNSFYNKLESAVTDVTFKDITHVNTSSTFSSNGASKDDFMYAGNSVSKVADSVDFMVYIGHGIAADRIIIKENQNDRTKGNYLHYNFSPTGKSHSGYDNCEGDEYSLFTSEAKFGSPTSKLRWVWLYTCNFLNTNAYVTDDDLKEMMNGAHIVMGYATQACLAREVAETMGVQLSKSEFIIDSFFIAGDHAEKNYASDNHIQKVLYMTGARYETITDLPKDYGTYLTNTVRILTNGIHDDVIWNPTEE